MRRYGPLVVCGVMAASFSALAFGQGASVRGPAGTGADVDLGTTQRGVQNSTQIGDGNQSSQVYGSGNQSTQQGADSQSNSVMGSGNTSSNTEQRGTQNQSSTGSSNTNTGVYQSGKQNQSAIGDNNQQSQQAGDGHSARQDSAASGSSAEPGDRGKHRGWDKARRNRDGDQDKRRGRDRD